MLELGLSSFKLESCLLELGSPKKINVRARLSSFNNKRAELETNELTNEPKRASIVVFLLVGLEIGLWLVGYLYIDGYYLVFLTSMSP